MNCLRLFIAAVALGFPALAWAKPVLVFETPGRTRYYIDDTSAVELKLREGTVVMARVTSKSAPDPRMTAGQVAADGLMQFRCADNSYRQWNVFSIGREGSRNQVIAPDAARAFTATRPDSFERRLLVAACALKRKVP